MENSKYLVYALCDPESDEIRYIGKSSSGMIRPNQHVYPSFLKDKTHKNNWIKYLIKNQKLPIIKVLRYCLSENDAFCSEIEYIKYYKSIGSNLTNLTDGGPGDGKRKRKPVIATNIKYGTKKRYESISETMKDGFSINKVVAVCKGKRLSHLGHFFCYENSPMPQNKSKVKKIVIITDLETNQKMTFDSIKNAIKYLNLSRSTFNHHYSNNKSYNNKYTFDIIKNEIEIQLDNGRCKYKQETIFNETKSMEEWLKDPRCKVNYEQYISRIDRGKSPEYALTTPIGLKIIGQDCKISKITNDIAYTIREMADNGISYAQISRDLNISETTVSGIAKRQRWNHLPERTEENRSETNNGE